jgi:hypothetical protein
MRPAPVKTSSIEGGKVGMNNFKYLRVWEGQWELCGSKVGKGATPMDGQNVYAHAQCVRRAA